MFEILTILTLYSRGSLHERVKILYSLYSFHEGNMTVQEFEFLISKVCASVGETLSVKKQFLHDIAELGKPKLIPDEETITEEKFITSMLGAFRDFNLRIKSFSTRIDVFNACVRKDRLPAYLMPGETLLGIYQIDTAVPYQEIIKTKLTEKSSVFLKRAESQPHSSTSDSLATIAGYEDVSKIHDPSALGQDYMTLFGTNYIYRVKTKAIYEDDKVYIFDVFIVHNDIKLAEFNLFKNYW